MQEAQGAEAVAWEVVEQCPRRGQHPFAVGDLVRVTSVHINGKRPSLTRRVGMGAIVGVPLEKCAAALRPPRPRGEGRAGGRKREKMTTLLSTQTLPIQ